MNPFDVLPHSLFQLLVGKNKKVYAEALILLYDQYINYRIGIHYQVMRDLIQEMLETKEEKGEVFIDEDEGISFHDENAKERERANFILRRFKELKWIDVEVRGYFEEYIVLPRYSSKIIALLKELCQENTVEYQRYSFITFQLLTGEDIKQRAGYSIQQALKFSNEWIEELVSLMNNMKYHMEEIVTKTKIEDVLDHHLEIYKEKIIDKSYHRLQTSDHVSRYRQKILSMVQQFILSDEFIQKAAEDILDQHEDEEQARIEITRSLYQIESIYTGLDELLNQINSRHNQYLHAMIERARYLSNYNSGFEQKIATILEWATNHLESELDVHLRPSLLDIHHIQEKSLFSPRKKRPLHQAEKHTTSTISEQLKAQVRDESIKKLKKSINRKKVNSFVRKKLEGQEIFSLEGLKLSTNEDLLYLAYTYLYGYDGKSDYRLKRDQLVELITKKNITFTNRTLELQNKE